MKSPALQQALTIIASADAKLLAIVALWLSWMSGFGADAPAKPGPEALDSRLPAFIKAKEQQARSLARTLDVKVSPDIWKAFELFSRADWQAATNHFDRLLKRYDQEESAVPDETLRTPVWQPILEVSMACELFAFGEPKYARAFGDDIIATIPKGSIFFGGTDSGRGLVTALSRSQIDGDPFFTLTQNGMADDNYLTYVRQMYGQQ